MTENEVWTVQTEAELAHLLPAFIENRWHDLGKLRRLTENNGFDEIKRLGHGLQGSPGAFGFDYLVQLGREMESASERQDLQSLQLIAEHFQMFMSNHHVTIV